MGGVATPIKNYTTKIAAERTIGEIQVLLRRWKVREVSVKWDEKGVPTAVWFVLPTTWGDRAYLLPANVDGVWRALVKSVNAKLDREQAARVAWRTVQDWLEAQLALIEAGGAGVEQVMLPYMQADDEGHTMYELAEARYQKALPAGVA